jgi:hypothetical protein
MRGAIPPPPSWRGAQLKAQRRLDFYLLLCSSFLPDLLLCFKLPFQIVFKELHQSSLPKTYRNTNFV